MKVVLETGAEYVGKDAKELVKQLARGDSSSTKADPDTYMRIVARRCVIYRTPIFFDNSEEAFLKELIRINVIVAYEE